MVPLGLSCWNHVSHLHDIGHPVLCRGSIHVKTMTLSLLGMNNSGANISTSDTNRHVIVGFIRQAIWYYRVMNCALGRRYVCDQTMTKITEFHLKSSTKFGRSSGTVSCLLDGGWLLISRHRREYLRGPATTDPGSKGHIGASLWINIPPVLLNNKQ